MKSRVGPSHEHIRVKIQTLAKEGMAPKDVVKKLKIGRITVFKWKDKTTIIDNKRVGRPKILSSADKKTNKGRNVSEIREFSTKNRKSFGFIKA